MIEDIYKQIADLPPVANVRTPDPLTGAPPGKVRCACGKKFMPMADITYHRTGLVEASDTECRECLPAHKGFALVVCLKCAAVVAKLPPFRAEGGFEMKADRCYHVTQCPTCQPGLTVSHVLEKYLHDREQGLPVPDIREVMPVAPAQTGVVKQTMI